MNNLPAKKIVHLQALMAWNGISYKKALEIVKYTSYEELNKITFADYSFNSAKYGIEKILLNGNKIDENYLIDLKPDSKEYFEKIKDYILTNMDTETFYNKVILIIDEIHKTWIENNTQKCEDFIKTNNKKLFQFLPTALIDTKEVAKDLMALSPILDSIGLNVGYMERRKYGSFVPSKEINKTYNIYKQNFINKNNINDDIEQNIKKYILNKKESTKTY